jgi:hypothetical protein
MRGRIALQSALRAKVEEILSRPYLPRQIPTRSGRRVVCNAESIAAGTAVSTEEESKELASSRLH